MKLAIGLGLALASALALNWGFFVQHGASSEAPALSLRRPLHSLWALFSNLKWLLGWAVGIGGWGLYITALVFAPISLVQAFSAGGIGLLAVFVWRRSGGDGFSRLELRAIWASLAGLALLCASFAGGVPRVPVTHLHDVLIWIGANAALAGIAWGAGSRLRPGAGLGAAAGLLYAAGDISTKGAVGGAHLILVPIVVMCHVLGFVALQLSFQRGSALATAGIATLLNNAMPIMAGVLLFGERLPSGAPGILRALAFALVALAAACLARGESSVTELAKTSIPACRVETRVTA